MFSLGIQEIVVIAIVILLLIDYRKIPEFAKGVGKIFREIKSAQENIKNEILREDLFCDKDGESSRGTEGMNDIYDDIKGNGNGSNRAG
ncbi:MAG: twin-arginine translocase TatA/TatE family subunit [Deltaproteobacteria bacterium]|nr:twin-arginine translocase TatA/TatE family subunit [Deltaproteobacteria bacterium]